MAGSSIFPHEYLMLASSRGQNSRTLHAKFFFGALWAKTFCVVPFILTIGLKICILGARWVARQHLGWCHARREWFHALVYLDAHVRDVFFRPTPCNRVSCPVFGFLRTSICCLQSKKSLNTIEKSGDCNQKNFFSPPPTLEHSVLTPLS